MSKVSICIPCYNEEKNIELVYNKVKNVMKTIPQYEYEIIYEDNDSTDSSKTILEQLAKKDKNVKVIFNARNFGPRNSARNCCFNATGDVIICIACDLQDPPEMIPEFLKYWDAGELLVLGQKKTSKESRIKYFLRSIYYKIIKNFSDIPQYEQVTGFGAIDKRIYDLIKELNCQDMSIRHILAHLGFKAKVIPYDQQKRTNGKSSYNIFSYFDFAVTSMVTTSTFPIKMLILSGGIGMFTGFLAMLVISIIKLFNWTGFACFKWLVLGVIIFVSGLQLFGLGMMGEYMNIILNRVTKKPMVVEERKINFEKD